MKAANGNGKISTAAAVVQPASFRNCQRWLDCRLAFDAITLTGSLTGLEKSIIELLTET